MSMCMYMHRDVLKGCVRFLISERTQDYRSQMEAGATPVMFLRYIPCPSPSFPSYPLPKPQHASACKEKYFELFLPLQVQSLN